MTNKLVGIDILRIFCAFSVLVYHYQHFYYSSVKPPRFLTSSQPLYDQLKFVYEYGHYGVQVFWCISGFVFYTTYLDRIKTKSMPLAKYVLWRVSRLYPLHFVTLLIVGLLQSIYHWQNEQYFVYQLNDMRHFLLQLVMGSHWGLQRGTSYNGPIWSVSVEIIVYMIFYATIYAGLRTWVVNLLYIFVSLVCLKLHLFSSVMECIAYFFAGGMAALSVRRDNNQPLVRTLPFVLYALAAESIVWLAYVRSSPYFISLLLITNIPLLLRYLSFVHFSSNLEKVISTLSSCTYSTYLLHFPIQLLIKIVITVFLLPAYYDHPGAFIAFILATYILGFLSFRFLELPTQNLIRRHFELRIS